VGTVKQIFVNPFRGRGYENLLALDNVSFEVKKGEFFGIIGANGSGKSTMLKILAGIYKPSSGYSEIKGKSSPFIELGVGFNPELTARENIFLNAAILGLSKKETEERFEDIIKFSELEQFLDQKLKNFSSGMQVRLAFSIAIQANADVLLIDEVLAVGDASFQQKCFDVFRDLKNKGVTIVFVSHALNIVGDFSDRVALLNKGKLFSIGKPQNVINDYLSLVTEKEAEVLQLTKDKQDKEKRWGDRRVKVIDAWVETKQGNKTLVVKDKTFRIVVGYEFAEDVKEPIFGVRIRDSSYRDVYVINTKWKRIKTGSFKKGQKIRVSYEFSNVFEDGEYTITPGVADQNAIHLYDRRNNFKRFIIRKYYRTGGVINMPININIRST
jgi:ABC-type polysaccharide/polyol phosphate transport system ATPase subunit